MVGGQHRETEDRLTMSDPPLPKMKKGFSQPVLSSWKAVEKVSLGKGGREVKLTKG